jgi:hypothetical protein
MERKDSYRYLLYGVTLEDGPKNMKKKKHVKKIEEVVFKNI